MVEGAGVAACSPALHARIASRFQAFYISCCRSVGLDAGEIEEEEEEEEEEEKPATRRRARRE